ncbi:MAG: amino acid permease-associated region [Chloroflexota bacterium]|jgi:amino acid transporter|nr:amino acid permease-associated region [Chloroflexota bacterium]
MESVSRETPSLFLRNATGLVKGWSGFDAFTYSFMAVNLVTLGMFYSLAVFAYVPGASPVLSIVLAAVAVTFLAVAYAGLVAVMPRAGGDYVWQSRILDGIPGIVTGAVVFGVAAYLVAQAAALDGTIALVAGVAGLVAGGLIGRLRGGIGFVLAATGWWFILAMWAPIYGAILKLEFFQPLAALIGSSDGVAFFGSDNGTLVVSIIVIILTAGLVALGMAGYARIQRWCLYAGLLGFAIMAVLMLVSSQADFQAAFDRASSSLFGVTGAYDQTIADAATNDAFAGSLDPLAIGDDFGATLTATLAMIPFMLFWILYPNWGSTLYGEVRGSGDFNKVLRGMLGGIWVTAILAIIFVLLAAKTFGWLFFNATNVNFINWFYGYTTTDPTVPIWSYPPLLASYLVDNTIFQIAMVVLFGAWFLGWSGTLFLSSTRMIFAAAFDRVLPESAARVTEGRGVPVVALLYIMIPAVLVSIAYSYSADVRALTLDATLVIAITFLGSTVAATILPWYKPRIFDNSPVAHLKLVISGAGLITSIILAWTIYLWLTDPLYGIGVGNTNSIMFLGALYGLAALVYVGARLYRRSQGVDLDAIHAEIPAD